MGYVLLTACQPSTQLPTPTKTLPLTPKATAYPWIPVSEGQNSLNVRRGKCVHRAPIFSFYPAMTEGLREYVPVGFRIGAAVSGFSLMGVSQYNVTAAQEFNVLTPENSLKFENVHPEPGRYSFCETDTIIAFAEVNGMSVRGHPLVWEQQLPAWVREVKLSEEQWPLLLQDHVTQLVSRYEGKIEEWDVVNEPFTEEGTLKETIWMQHLGPQYIDLSLRWAHEANPDAQLFINDFATENLNPKSDALYALAQDLLARGIPLHGIGFQMHLFEAAPPDPAQVAANFQRFNDLGLEVAITEMDVRILKPATPEKLTHEAEIYQAMLEACLSASKCDTFVLWGVSDRNSWINDFFPDFESPLILDGNYHPKPAYWALLDALKP